MNMTGSLATQRLTLTEGHTWLEVWALLLPQFLSGSKSYHNGSLLGENPHCSHGSSLGQFTYRVLTLGTGRRSKNVQGGNLMSWGNVAHLLGPSVILGTWEGKV